MSAFGAHRKKENRVQRLVSARDAAALFLQNRGKDDQLLLSAFWDNWPMIAGEELASLAQPLGHKDKILLLGADDNMAMQELSLQAPELLERANAFMDRLFFERVKVVLLQGKRPLSVKRPRRSTEPETSLLPPRPPRLGALLGKLDPASPVARCSEAYVRLYSD